VSHLRGGRLNHAKCCEVGDASSSVAHTKSTLSGEQSPWGVVLSANCVPFVVVFGVNPSWGIVSFKTVCEHTGLHWLAAGKVSKLRILGKQSAFKVVLSKVVASELAIDAQRLVSHQVRSLTGWHAVLDIGNPRNLNRKAHGTKVAGLPLTNSYEGLELEETERKSVEGPGIPEESPTQPKSHPKVRPGLQLGTFNFCGLTSDRKQHEVGQVLRRNQIHICAGQETWELPDKPVLNVPGYVCFGSPCTSALPPAAKRGHKGVGFYVCDYLVDQCEIICIGLQYEHSRWLRVKGQNGKKSKDLYVSCIYMPTSCQI
jgi:hypothetical protein